MDSVSDIMSVWAGKLLADPGRSASINATYRFVVDGADGGEWLFKCSNPPSVVEGSASKGMQADCTISLPSDILSQVANGKLNPQAAFLQGKIRVTGDVSQALKLHHLIS